MLDDIRQSVSYIYGLRVKRNQRTRRKIHVDRSIEVLRRRGKRRLGGIRHQPFSFFDMKVLSHFQIKYKSLLNLLVIIFKSNSKERAQKLNATTNQIQCIMLICIWLVFDLQNRLKNSLGWDICLKKKPAKFLMVQQSLFLSYKKHEGPSMKVLTSD